jgi:hypothetical protein
MNLFSRLQTSPSIFGCHTIFRSLSPLRFGGLLSARTVWSQSIEGCCACRLAFGRAAAFHPSICGLHKSNQGQLSIARADPTSVAGAIATHNEVSCFVDRCLFHTSGFHTFGFSLTRLFGAREDERSCHLLHRDFSRQS